MTLDGQARRLEEGVTQPRVVPHLRRVAFYARTSSDDQRERETINTQVDELHRVFALAERVELVGEFYDAGVSGTIPLEERPRGKALLDWCRRALIDEVWVTRPNRIGRKTIHILSAVDAIDSFGVSIIGVLDPLDTRFILTIKAAVAEEERRVLLENSAAGMNRAAREGRYTGGIVPLGYRVEGQRQNARLVPSDVPMWADLTEADVARLIFQRLAEGRSCTQIAVGFTALGIPTAYGKDGRGIRGQRTQEVWRPNRIYDLATRTTYRGEQQYGRHSKKLGGREVISAPVPRPVSDEVWYAAQETLHGNHLIPDGKRTTYLLRSLMVCDACGQRYYGATGADRPGSYRCGGQSVARRLELGRCYGRSIPCSAIDGIVWDDIEHFLRHPGEILEELAAESAQSSGATAVAEAEDALCLGRLDDLAQQRSRAIDLHVRGRMSEGELDDALQRVEQERAVVEAHLRVQGFDTKPPEKILSLDLLEEVRSRLDAGLTAAQRQEIAQLLVTRITVHTEVMDERHKTVKIKIEYAFDCVVASHTDSRWRRSRPSPRMLPRMGSCGASRRP